jgi:hypothetical protein
VITPILISLSACAGAIEDATIADASVATLMRASSERLLIYSPH